MADDNLHELGPVPGDIEALIERYLGSRRISAAQADVLLRDLGAGSAAPASVPPPRAAASAPISEFRREHRRYDTPFPQGIAGADDLPDFNTGRGMRTPPPGFYPPARPGTPLPPRAATPAPARTPTPIPPGFNTPPPPAVFSPPSASAAWLPAPEESAVVPVSRTPVPAALTPVPAAFPAPSQPPPAAAVAAQREDSYEILVDDEVLELEPDDLLIEDVTDEDEA